MKRFLFSILATVLPGWLILFPTVQAKAVTTPNIVVILADDLGYADVGFQGARDIPTPHLDKLATSGVQFRNGYSSHPFCSPMRAGLMTGRYQHRFGYERNIAFDPHNAYMGLPIKEKTVASRLKKANYRTGLIGKWHLGAAMQFLPNRRGFDFFYGFPGGGHDYFKVDLNRPAGEAYQQPLHRNGQPETLTNYLTTALTQEAEEFVRRNSKQPFFLFLSYNAPHTPMQAPSDQLEKFASISNKKRRAYAAMVHVMDHGIGQLLSTLDQLNLRTNTVVFFLSDNGGPEAANASDNGPLKGSKGDVNEGGIRVPFLVSWPGTLPAGRVSKLPVISLDITATALALAGIQIPKSMDGINLVPLLTQPETPLPQRALFWRKENGASWAVRSGNLKLLQAGAGKPAQLFDLSEDIGETKNLAKERPEDAARLQALFDKWNADNIPPFFPSFREYHKHMREVYQNLPTGF